MRKMFFLSYDVMIMAIAPFFALFIRDHYDLALTKSMDILPYTAISVMISIVLFSALKTHQILWRHVALPDFLRLIAAITGAIILTLVFSFLFSRLDGVARSLPFIHWAFAVSMIIGARLFIRLQMRIPKKQNAPISFVKRKHVLVVGLNPVAELYLRCVSDLGKGSVIVEGILNERSSTKGRLLHGHKVIGSPTDLPTILAQYNVHGINITDIVITTPFDALSQHAQAQLLHWERSGSVTLDLFEERLGFSQPQVTQKTEVQNLETSKKSLDFSFQKQKFCHNGYLPVKRGFDVVASLALMVICTPLILIAALLVAIDLKLPLIFWQQRPGLFGKPFRLYKFRTMAAAHDRHGRRIPDDERLSKIGKFLRKTRLDELPQLYHVLIGEMSFVGPRPLLPVDIPKHGKSRFNMRPGITGWAQINGGHSVPADEKMALDIWYMNHVSFAMDIKIMVQTIHVAIFGEKINKEAIKAAEIEFRKVITLSEEHDPIKQAA